MNQVSDSQAFDIILPQKITLKKTFPAEFFSNTSYSFNESKYISVDFKWDLMCQFIDLNELILIVEKNLKNENIYAKEKDLYEHFLEYCLYLNGEDAGN